MEQTMENIATSNDQSSVENQNANIGSDNTLMSAFDVDGGGASSQGASTNNGDPSGNPGVNDNAGSVEYHAQGQLPEHEIRYRKLQSQYDRLFKQNEQTVTEYQEALKAKEFVSELMEDDEVFEAFVFERKPELIEHKDLTTKMQERLEAKFGDYKPDSRDDTSPQAYLYFKELDELYDSMRSKGNPKKLSELKEARKREQTEQKRRIESEIGNAKKAMNWDDDQVANFQGWANKLKVVDLMKMYNFAIRTNRISPSSSVASSRGSGLIGKTARESFLNSLK